MRGNKNKKKIIIAIVVGMVPAVLVFNMINAQTAQIEQLKQQASQKPADAVPAAPVDPIVSVVQAKVDIKSGEVITITKLERKQYKKSEIPANSYNNESYLLGKISSQNILTGKIVTSDDILDVDPNLMNIPPGMRAITIPATSIQGLAKYIFVGSRVDILSVKATPEFIAQNVKIISLESNAIDTAPAPVAPPPPSSPFGAPAQQAPVAPPTPPAKTKVSADKAVAITVLVPIESVDKLVEGIVGGKLQIITRGADDNKIVKKHIPSSSSVSKVNLPPPPTNISKLPVIPTGPIESFEEEPKSKVEIITANKKEQVCFDDSGNQMKSCSTSKPASLSSGGSSSGAIPLPSAPPSKSLNDLLKMMK